MSIRPSHVPARGHGSVVRQLSRMPSGSQVRLFYGAVYTKFVRRWMVAGVIGDPITSTALSSLNGGVMPAVMASAWGPNEVTP